MALFPIHDIARADDIRMRRRRALLLLAGIVVAGWTLLVGQDDTSHHRDQEVATASPPQDVHEPLRSFRMAPAGVLSIDLPCADRVTLLPRDGLGDQVLVSAQRGQEAALQAIELVDGRLGQSRACDGDDDDLTLQIAADRPLRISQTGASEIHGGHFRNAVSIDVDGSGSVSLDGVGQLDDTQTGDGDVAIGSVSGAVTARLRGSGNLRIGNGVLPRLDASSTGSGDIDMGRAVIAGGQVILDGSGDFSAHSVTGGSFAASTSRSGDIAIDSLHVGDMQVRGSGSGDIVLRGGLIGRLTADRRGSGDLVVNAAVSDGRVSHDGSGDVMLPHAANAVTGD